MSLKTLIIITVLSLPCAALPQTYPETMANKICTCIGEEEMDEAVLKQKIDTCSKRVISEMLEDSTAEIWNMVYRVEDVEFIVRAIYGNLVLNCTRVRHMILMNRRSMFYSPPKSEKALYYFQLGMMLYETEEYPMAASYFRMADKSEKGKSMILDYLGMCYYYQGDLKKAFKYFKKSLKIFSDSDIAILKMAQIYLTRGDYNEAWRYFERYYRLYPESPEGYYGLAQISFRLKSYESAVEWAIIAYAIYEPMHTEKLAECSELLRNIYLELDKMDKTYLFKKMIKDYQLQLEQLPWLEDDESAR